MTDALRKAHESLEAAVAEIVFGDDWRRISKVASSFHRYGLLPQVSGRGRIEFLNLVSQVRALP